ncbi:MAG: hypothetical protein IPF57_07665 [Gammaproteobacteria bacterium]|nr:hypothetical protein [Gammaproteobacteria bacterium]
MLDRGLQGLILEYDLPTTNGYDSDNLPVAGEVGRAGTALDSLEDLEEAFDLPFDKLQVPDERVQRAAAGQPRDDHCRAGEEGRRPASSRCTSSTAS